MAMRFWRLEEPDYGSDYRHTYINGSLEHPYALPGIACDTCGATWGGSRVLPFACPLSLREHKHLVDRWPVSVTEHQALQRQVCEEFAKQGVDLPPLRPGDSFQPGYLDIPSKPEADFLWSGIGSVIVSARLKHLFETLDVQEVAFCGVTPRKVGKRNAKLPPPTPSTGEPEDLVNEVPLLPEAEGVGPYYEMLVLSESDYPRGGRPTWVCPTCGWERISDEARELAMLESMWRGRDVFFLATTLRIVVTERVQRALRGVRATNVRLEAYPEG